MKYVKLMRIKHYVKNGLVFLPLFFTKEIDNLTLLTKVFVGFVTFSLLASIVYILNDILDKDKDKLHPLKQNRPIAMGIISVKEAVILGCILFIVSCLLNLTFNNYIYSWAILGIYLLTNIAYSLKLKDIPLVDISIVVLGFFLRILFGGIITDTAISNWLYLTVISMSFYLALGKRRNELQRCDDTVRTVLKHYTKAFLDKNMYMCLGLTIVFYSLWCISLEGSQSEHIIVTVPLVLIICMKYSMNIERDSFGDPADVLFSDKVLIGLVCAYCVAVTIIIY